MRAWSHLLLVAPVSNNWMWTDDMPRLTSLVGLKWQGLTSWHAQFLSSSPIQPKLSLQQQQAQAVLSMQLNSAQTELELRLTTVSHTAQTHLNLSIPNQSLEIPLKTLDTLANMVTDWMAQQLAVPLDAPSNSYSPVTQPEQLACVAQLLYNELDKPTADGQLLQWITKLPDSHMLPRLMGERCQQSRLYAKAIHFFQLALKHTPDTLVHQRSKDATMAGLCAILAGQPAIGRRWMEAAIAWSPNLPGPRLHLGLTLESENLVPEALEQLLAYHQLVPDDSRALYGMARLYALQQDWANVINQYENLLGIVDPDVWLYCDLASAYLQLNKPDKANHWFKAVLEHAPADHPAVEMAKLAMGMDVVI
jgi:hypothetical protein